MLRLSQSEGSSRCSFFSLFSEDASLLSSHIPRFFACRKKKKEREKMATSRGVDRRFRRQKSWRKGKTSGDATQGNAPKARPSHLTTAGEVNKVSLKDSAFEDHKGRVLQRTQTLNWDTTTVILRRPAALTMSALILNPSVTNIQTLSGGMM